MNQSIAMNVRTPMPDLAEITRSAQAANLNDYQLRNAPMKSELEGLQLQSQIGSERAMADYRGAVGRGDPNAMKQLDGQPQMQAEMFKAFDGMSPQEFMQAAKRSNAFKNAAQHVLTMPKEKQPEAWHASIQVLKDQGFIDDRQFRMMDESGPSDLILQQALTASEWTQQYLAEKAKKGAPFTLGAGQTRFDADGTQIAAGPPKDTVANKPPTGYRAKDDGSLEPIPGGPADPNKPVPVKSLRPTTDQNNAAGFFDRMSEAEKVLGDPASVAAATDYWGKKKGEAPFGIGNYLATPEYQQFDQAVRDFINAQLRKESGAAIAESEFESARKQYFPQPGDGEDVIAQKERNRATARNAMKRTAAGALTQGQPAGDGQAEPANPETGEAPTDLSQEEVDGLLQQAIEAVDQGEDRAAVLHELLQMGVDPQLAEESLGQ